MRTSAGSSTHGGDFYLLREKGIYEHGIDHAVGRGLPQSYRWVRAVSWSTELRARGRHDACYMLTTGVVVCTTYLLSDATVSSMS